LQPGIERVIRTVRVHSPGRCCSRVCAALGYAVVSGFWFLVSGFWLRCSGRCEIEAGVTGWASRRISQPSEPRGPPRYVHRLTLAGLTPMPPNICPPDELNLLPRDIQSIGSFWSDNLALTINISNIRRVDINISTEYNAEKYII
jgi:hypothetical protein